MSIRIKLIIMFLAVALIPLSLVSLLTYNNYTASLEAGRIADLRNIADFKADKIETYFANLKDYFEIVQNMYVIKKSLPVLTRLAGNPADPEFVAAKRLTDGVYGKLPARSGLIDVMLTDPEGKVVYSSNPEHFPQEFSNLLPEPQQKAFVAGRNKIYFSDIFFNKAHGDVPQMLVTGPALDFDGNLLGVIAVEVDLSPIYKMINDAAGLGKSGETLIVKKTGNEVLFLNVLRHDPQAAMKRSLDLGGERGFAAQEAAQGRSGVGQYIDYRGEKVIGAWKYIPSLGWGIVAKMDREEAFSDAENLRKLVILVLIIISVLAGLVAFSIAQSISLPIKKLAQGAEIIGWGNLDHKIALSSRDEFGQLARAFDKMTEELSKSAYSLKQSSQYSRSLLETSLDPLVTISAEGKITDVNEATVKATGVLREELIGTDFSGYFTEPEKAREGYQRVFVKGYVVDYPLTIFHKNGRLTDVLYNASLYKDTQGNIAGIFAAARDVTAQKQASQYARSLIETSLDPLVTISAEGKITDVNEATIKATGVSRDELIETDFSDYFTEPEKASEGYRQVFEKGFVVDYPLTIRHKSGKLMDVLYNASVYKDSRGNVLGIFAAARDVTVQKQVEAELKRHRDNLEELVKARTLELEISNSRLARSNENLEQFAYVASHDLQEPLRIMASYSQLLERRYMDKLDKDANDFIEFIVDAAKRMQRLITDLLAYSRLRHTDAPMAEFKCNKLLARVIDSMALTIQESGAEVTHDELPTIRGYEINLLQLFQNLIGNAIKFHGREKPMIHVGVKRQGGEWVFSVKDNGIGIDPQYQERIFLIFQRLHGKDEYPGTGIGLAICKKIVENHGGRIWVESVFNQGSTFYFTIPITKGGVNG